MSDEQPWRIDAEDRYHRMKQIAWWSQERLAESKVLVVGVGALGNEVLKNLALLGVGELWIVDPDLIEVSNLGRSAFFRSGDVGRAKVEVVQERVRELNSEIEVEGWFGTVQRRVGLGRLQAMDIVVGCVDNREARWWLNQQCQRVGVAWIDAGLDGISGMVQPFHPERGACYECGMTDLDFQKMAARQRCHGLVEEGRQGEAVPTSPTVASMIAGLQSQWVVKHLHGLSVPWGEAWIWNGEGDRASQVRLPRREECLAHERWEVTSELPSDYLHRPWREWMKKLEEAHGLARVRLQLDATYWEGWRCGVCGESELFEQPQRELEQGGLRCPGCGEERHGLLLTQVDGGCRWSESTPFEFGVCAEDWWRFYGEAGGSVGGDRGLVVRLESGGHGAS